MLLIDASKLDYVKVSHRGLFKIGRLDKPNEYEAVTAPIKVKLAPDVLVLFDTLPITEDPDSYEYESYNQYFKITYDILNSTRRKFKDEYVIELLSSMTEYDMYKGLIRFIHNDSGTNSSTKQYA